MKCKECGKDYQAIKKTVEGGQGLFCSHKCYTLWYKKNISPKSRGYENGKAYWSKGKCCVHWHDDIGKEHVTTYPRWWWEQNVGKVENGYLITYIDGDFSNIDPSNFECVTVKIAKGRGGRSQAGKTKPWMAGSLSKWWKGGRDNEYPPEFSKRIKRKIKTRDNYTCQACLCAFHSERLDVHHKDKDKNHNVDDNLVTLCKSCHKAVHGKENKTNRVIEELKNLLRYSNNDAVELVNT
jgi:hypothetical protein